MSVYDILDDLKVPYIAGGTVGHVRHGWIGLNCPQCGNQNGYLGYNVAGNYTTCWHCGPMSFPWALSQITNISYKDIQAKLKGVISLYSSEREELRGTLKFPDGTGEMLKPHKDYLKSRKLDPDEMTQLWGLLGTGPASGRMSWRIVIPIQRRTETVSWTSRAISDKNTLRYRAAGLKEEKMSGRDVLFGRDYVRHGCVVCEGPFDVMRVGPGAVSTSGIAFSQRQIAALATIPIRAICFDSDKDGQRKARELARELESFEGQTYVVELNAKDPGSSSRSEIKELRKRFLED